MAKRKPIPSLIEYLENELGTWAGNSDELSFFCPFCLDKEGSESSVRKFSVNVVTGKSYCFRCGTGFSQLEKFFRARNNGGLKIVEAAIIKGEFKPPLRGLQEVLAEKIKEAKVEQSIAAPDPSSLRAHKLPKEYVPLTQCQDSPLRRIGYNYFVNVRKLDPELIDTFKVGYCPSGRYAGRLVFPVFQNEKQVYFTTRYCGKHTMKSLNPENIDGYHRRDSCLLNYDNCKGYLKICLSEGPISVCAHKRPPAVGLMGKVASETQIQLLEQLVPLGLRELVISLDADAGKAVEKLYAQTVNRFPRVSVLMLDKGDPDERRDDLPGLLQERRVPNLMDKMRSRLVKNK